MRKAPAKPVQKPQTDAPAGEQATPEQQLQAAVGALQALYDKHTELAEYHVNIAGQLRRLLGR